MKINNFLKYLFKVSAHWFFISAGGFLILISLVQPLLPFSIENFWFKKWWVWFLYLFVFWIISSYSVFKKINDEKIILEKRIDNKVDYKITVKKTIFNDWFKNRSDEAKKEIDEITTKIEGEKNILVSITRFGFDTPERRMDELKKYIDWTEEYVRINKDYIKVNFLIQNIGNEVDSDINIRISSNYDIHEKPELGDFFDGFLEDEIMEYPEKKDMFSIYNKPITINRGSNKPPFREIISSDDHSIEIELRMLRVKEPPVDILVDSILIHKDSKKEYLFKIVSNKTKKPIEKKIHL
ncbi:hypothetical protein KAJ89_04400 [Candidatus Parcubacteria bacterium]|nr:hypothetical protein [Candidatus Parcubacteria bacterium]